MTLRALETASAGMKVQEANLDGIAQDMSNMNTTGYKRTRTEFHDLMYQTLKEPGGESGSDLNPVGIQVGSGAKIGAQYAIHEPGAIKNTGGSLDLAILGDGFFSVQLPNGSTAYTRDGSFKLDPQGRVVTNLGYSLIPNIQIPQQAANVQIAADGSVRAQMPNGQQTEAGRIQITAFINPSGLKRIGDNMLISNTAAGEPIVGAPGDGVLGTLQQGALEASNVKPTEAITDLMKTQRIYETNAKIMNVADQMWATTNNIGSK